VEIFDQNFQPLLKSALVKSNQFQPAKPLPRAQSYYWQVIALKDGDEIVAPEKPAPDAIFKVISAKQFQQLTALKQSHPESHLTLGIIYAQAGLLVDAVAEFRALPRNDERSGLAHTLADNIEKWRKRE